jgi:prepilin-type N-terminal cleavage/methylation domain-containing protein
MKKRVRSGFTLIELLVVVSIIALLIAILLPSLKRAREQAKQAVCLAGLTGTGKASIVYAADDASEAAIPVHHRGIETTQISRTDVMVYCYGGKSGRGKGPDNNQFFWGTGFHKGPASRPLNKFLYKEGFPDYGPPSPPDLQKWKEDTQLDLGLFKCPSDTGYTGGFHRDPWKESKLSSYDHFGTSFAANAAWIVDPNVPACGGGSCCWSNGPLLRPLSRIPNPSNTIYYQENNGRFSFLADPVSCGAPEEGIIKGWHGRDWMFDVTYADGHSANLKMKGMIVPAPALSSYPSYLPETWQCVINRGTGYQLDTLPSPPVRTEIPCS